MDQLDRNLALSVGEGTELPILAFECIVGVAVAEFASIPTEVVELLNFVMGVGAVRVAIPGIIATEDVAVVTKVGSPFVAVAVVVDTGFSVMVVWFFSLEVLFGAGFDFEIVKVESEKLSVLEVNSVLLVGVWAVETEVAIVVIARFGFIEQGMVDSLVIVQAI